MIFINSSAQAADGDFIWAKVMGGMGADQGYGIAVDGAGNVYTTGRFQGTADFDPGAGTFNLTSSASYDIFVSKIDSAGNFVWAKAMGGMGADQGYGIAVDSAGNVYTTGYFVGTVDFDPGAGTFNLISAGGSWDIFVSKLDSAGNFVWAKAMGGTGYDSCRGIAVDGAGNVYTTGYFVGTVDFDPGAGTFNLISAGGSWDIFVSKLDSAGNFVWAKAMGGTGDDRGYGIAVDGAGNVYSTGTFNDTVDFDPGAGTFNLTSAGIFDIFVSKLDSAGSFVWAKGMGGTSNDYCIGIAVDGASNVYTTGYFVGTADFDPGAGSFNLTSAGSDDIFMSKLDSTGDFVWARSMGGTSADRGYGIAVDSVANVYSTGTFIGMVDFDPGAGTFNLTSAGGNAIFVSKLDSAGNFVWAKGMDGTDGGIGSGIAVDSVGNVYTTGYFSGTVDFDPGAGTFNLTSAGGYDVFVSKLSGPPPDVTQPTVTINQQVAQADPTNALPITFDVVFSEAVTGFAADDVAQSGTATGVTFTVTAVDTSHYTVRATVVSVDGTIQPTIASGGANDAAGNGNTASTSTDNTVTLDRIAPTVTINQQGAQADPTNALPIAYDVVFSEAVTGFAADDVAQSGTATGVTFTVTAVDTSHYTVRATVATTDGTIQPTIAAGGATDVAGNGNTASTSTDDTVTLDRIVPTVTINQQGAQADPTNTLPIAYDVVFSEAVTGFAAGDVAQSGTATGVTFTVTTVDSSHYTVRATVVSVDGTIQPTIAAGGATDAAGNGNTTSTSTDNTVTLDRAAPTVTINQQGAQADPTNVLPIAYDVVFSEAVTGFAAGDVAQSGTATGVTFTVTAVDTSHYTIRATVATTDGTIQPTIAAGGATDAAGNGNTASTSTNNTVTLDRVAPTVTINQQVTQADPTNTLPIAYDVVFSEAVTGFAAGDVAQSGTATGVTFTVTAVDTSHYTVRAADATTDGTIQPTIASGGATDAAGNGNTTSASTDNTVTLDRAAPTVTINQQGAQADPTNALPIAYDVVFSEAVTGFAAGDVAQSGTATGVTFTVTAVDASHYTVRAAAATTDGTIQPTIAAGGATDAAGNGNTASTSTNNTVTLDRVTPTVTINQQVTQADPTNTLPIAYDVVFSEAVTGFAAGDVAQSGTATGVAFTVAAVDASHYTVRATVVSVDGTIQPTIDAGGANDVAGNGNTASTSTDNTVTLDRAAPTVTINQQGGQADPTNALPIAYDVVFSEAVTGFTVADMTQSGTATGVTFTVTAVDASHYTVRAADATTDGTIQATIAAGGATDAAGNGNTTSTSTDNTVTLDRAAPTVTINQQGAQADPTNALPIAYDVVFSEAVTGFAEGDVAQSGTATGVTFTVTAVDTSHYTVRATAATTDGTIQPTIAAGGATDAAGNGNTASTSTNNTVTLDRVAPTVTINQQVAQADPTNTLPIIYDVVFSEAVTEFAAADVAQSGTATGVTFTVSAVDTSHYTVRATVVSVDGTVRPTITAGGAIDAAGNDNTASTSTDNSVTLDNVSPTVTINQQGAQADPSNALPILFDVVFSEAVTGFAAGDVTQLGTASGVTFTVTAVDASHYTIRATVVTGDGTVQPTIAAVGCVDAAGNGNAASTSTDNIVTLDRIAPTITIGFPNPLDTTTGPVTYELTYSEPCMISLDPSDVALGITGSATGEIAVSGSGNMARTVILQNISGSGTLWITVSPLADTDLAGNPVLTAGPSQAVMVTDAPQAPLAGMAGLALLTSLLAAAAAKRARKK